MRSLFTRTRDAAATRWSWRLAAVMVVIGAVVGAQFALRPQHVRSVAAAVSATANIRLTTPDQSWLESKAQGIAFIVQTDSLGPCTNTLTMVGSGAHPASSTDFEFDKLANPFTPDQDNAGRFVIVLDVIDDYVHEFDEQLTITFQQPRVRHPLVRRHHPRRRHRPERQRHRRQPSRGRVRHHRLRVRRRAGTRLGAVRLHHHPRPRHHRHRRPHLHRRHRQHAQREHTHHVSVTADFVPEDDETFTITLTGEAGLDRDGEPMPACAVGPAATGTILDDDTVVAPTISVGDASVVEGADGDMTTLLFPVTGPAKSPPCWATVSITHIGTSSSDLSYVTGPLLLLSETLTVSVIDDTIYESDETFDITVTGVFVDKSSPPCQPTDATGRGTIIDDDDAPTRPVVSIADVTQVEGDTGTSQMMFTITSNSSTPCAIELSMVLVTADGTDIVDPGADLLTVTGSRTRVYVVNGDLDPEEDETFRTELHEAMVSPPAVACAIGDGVGIGTITNDDFPEPVAIRIADAAITEGNAGTTTLSFAVTKPGRARPRS